ncbi:MULTISPECIES: calcium-binding protein [unclassified Yoonia]|uniref:calcium-binding protein n=1 Tax=unclassified Yoonia TaxID=2629118 RepID=UPI002AFEEABD|nr:MULTISPECIES: calcium-binding protein [unclassified Yoonia]
MTAFFPVRYLTSSRDSARSRITDLEIVRIGGTETLVSLTQFDGAVQSWAIAGPEINPGAGLVLNGPLAPGVTATIATLATGTDPVLLIGGGPDGTFQQVGLIHGRVRVTGDVPVPAGFQHGITWQQEGGVQIVYGGFATAGGIAALHFDGTGQFLQHGQTTTTSGPISALAAADGFVFTADSSANTLTAWQVSPDGTLAQVAGVGPEDGLWIATPTALKTAVVDGVTYLVLAAAGSSSLSVMEVGPAGNLIIRDHLLDTRETRFAGVTALDVVTESGRSYVIAGGADDGISVFLLLPGGQLQALAHLEDTTSIGLDNISAIVARGRDAGVDIFVASSSEAGITQLRFDPGPVGATITPAVAGHIVTGTAGNDILMAGRTNSVISGGDGDDILRDGPGSDMLTGGAGADLFILTPDGAPDMITDFELGKDRLDLSNWPMLRDITQLTMNITPTGFRIVYGDEELLIHSADGAAIDYRMLSNADVLGGMRLPVALVPGSPGPPTPPPSLLPPEPEPSPDQGGLVSMQTITRALAAENLADVRSALHGRPVPVAGDDRALIGTDRDDMLISQSGDDLLLGRAGDDTLVGGSGADYILGGGGNNHLRGGDGHDILIGGDGDDRMDGGNGDDLLIAGNGNNRLDGGNGDDLLIGGDGDDWLRGGAGNDVMFGGAGADTFVFAGGHDVIVDYEQGIDRLVFGAEVWTGMTSVADLMFVYGSWDGSRVTFDFGNGDILWVEGVTDYASFGDDIALF